MKRLIVSLGDLGFETEVKFRDFLGEEGYPFWHRIPGIWLVVCDDDIGAFEMRAKIRRLFNAEISMVVAEVNEYTVAIALEDGTGEWFKRHWSLQMNELNPED